MHELRQPAQWFLVEVTPQHQTIRDAVFHWIMSTLRRCNDMPGLHAGQRAMTMNPFANERVFQLAGNFGSRVVLNLTSFGSTSASFPSSSYFCRARPSAAGRRISVNPAPSRLAAPHAGASQDAFATVSDQGLFILSGPDRDGTNDPDCVIFPVCTLRLPVHGWPFCRFLNPHAEAGSTYHAG